MNSGLGKYRGWLVLGALLVVLATANDVVGAVRGLYEWAMVPQGQAALLVLVLLLLAYLTLDRFMVKR